MAGPALASSRRRSLYPTLIYTVLLGHILINPAVSKPFGLDPHNVQLELDHSVHGTQEIPILNVNSAGKTIEEIDTLSCSAPADCAGTLCKRTTTKLPGALSALLDALDVMQSEFFELWAGTWPSSIDWTAAVLGTHISASLTTIISTIDYASCHCTDILGWENTINRYFTHLTTFYFGEDSFSLRNEAYDDMLWVVLEWLENVKFSTHYTRTYWQATQANPASQASQTISGGWHGTQLRGPAAHRARTFYELASKGWGTDLCGGGMTWNPTLEPYKNAITNELFISASIAMYLYFPGDDNESPFMASSSAPKYPPHEESYLQSAIDGYRWLKDSNMTNPSGLYMDGYHITGWKRYRNGTTDPGTRKCDELDSMVFTYNQGVLLSGLRGLWIATNQQSYLIDGHTLIQNVIRATGWPHHSNSWSGLGRSGILEEYCDSTGGCSQDGQTFKGIFFHHLAEFCRPLWDYEEEFMHSLYGRGMDYLTYRYHQNRCVSYTAWIEHNARAAFKTRNEKGLFGTWWGRTYDPSGQGEDARMVATIPKPQLPEGAVDYRNFDVPLEEPWISLDEDSLPVEQEDQLLPPIFNPLSRARRQKSFSNHRPSNDFIVTEDVNDRGRGRTVETQGGGVAVLRALWQWQALSSRYSTAADATAADERSDDTRSSSSGDQWNLEFK